MRNLYIKPGSPLRKFFPLIRKLRHWAWKFHDRTGLRLVISGGRVQFMDVELIFPENVGLTYSTPLFWNGPDIYELPTSRTLALLVSRSRLFLDIGSNIGIYSVYAGVKFPSVKTFAFEPVPVICEKNRAFHRANRLPETGVLNLAVGDRDGVQKFFLPIYNTGIEEEQTGTLNAGSWQVREEKVETFEVQCLTLDTFAAKNPPPAGAVTLKIDVENFEAAVLRGGKQFISARRPWIVCEILSNQETDPATGLKRNNNSEVVALVAELSYVTFAITADGFFRMTPADFSRPRTVKDFLLAPAEKISADTAYLSLTSLAELLPPA
jgi:FkbM family methyltransferase